MSLEALEPRQLLSAAPIISEFLARNDGGLRDGDGRSSDWIEIQNTGDTPADLAGYRLTDDPGDLARWVFPSVTIEPGQFLVVFASGQDQNHYVDPDGNLHTNFTLQRSGEYLGLVSPEGTIVSQFGDASTNYPEQRANVSFGLAQSQSLIDAESDTQYWVPLTDAVDRLWTQPEFHAAAHNFMVGKASLGMEMRPGDRVNFVGQFQTALPDRIHAVYTRTEFDVRDASAVSNLTLGLRYDDGFVAYLNGVKVAEDNAPANPAWFSPALERRGRDADVMPVVQFDISAHTNLLVDGKNVLAVHGLNALADRDDMLLTIELSAAASDFQAAFGSPGKVGYMPLPTPGQPNGGSQSVYSGLVADTQFSVDRGFYDRPQQVEITTETPGATIRFTTDGSSPSEANGSVYTGPITVGTTTTLRAMALKPDYLPTNIDTQTYLFLDDVLRQPARPPGLPRTWGSAGTADYGMDPRVAIDTSSPYYDPNVRDALMTHPVMSIVTDPDNLFDARIGLMANPQQKGDAWERPISLEYFQPDGSVDFQVNAGLRLVGKASRSPSRPKHNLRIAFRGEYGPTAVEFPFFDTTDVDTFDSLMLRGGNGDSWVNPAVIYRAQYLRDQWHRDVQLAMGHETAHQTYVHVYLNGLYWGLHHLFERNDADFMASHFGGRPEQYDVVKDVQSAGPVEAVSGNTDAWNQMMALVDRGLANDQAYQALEHMVDVDNLIDYLLLNFYSGNNDWDNSNWRAGRRRVEGGQWKFFSWDAERTMLNTLGISANQMGPLGINVTNTNNANRASHIHQQLARNPEYRLRFADHVQQQFFNGGPLSPEGAKTLWNARADEIRLALSAESARFGDTHTPDGRPMTVADWQEMLDTMNQTFFPARTGIVLDQLKARNLYPRVVAPSFNQHGGIIARGFPLTMSAPAGIIYYTTDGSDPRLAGGRVASRAVAYTEPVRLDDVTTVKSRVLQDGQWSALNQAHFSAGSDVPLRVTEINYHPHARLSLPGLAEEDVASDRFQFIELANGGTTDLDLGGMALVEAKVLGVDQGVRFTFAPQIVHPGERIVVVRDRQAFLSRYGDSVRIAKGQEGPDGSDGQFGGRLALDGEQLTLVDASGRVIQQFRYGSSGQWPQRADGKGSTLEIVDPRAEPGDPGNWRASDRFAGTPGQPPTSDMSRIQLSELLANTAEPDRGRIELYNPGLEDVDVTGWYLSDSADDYFRFRITTPTVVPALGYQVVSAAEPGLDLGALEGGQLFLTAADSDGRPLRFADWIRFGPSLPEVSVGPSPVGGEAWIQLDTPTLGGPNAGPLVGPITISEVYYNPIDPDGDRRQKAEDFQFIELVNHSTSSQDIGGWQLAGDVQFAFPEGTRIEPGETLVVVPFDPTRLGPASVFRFTLQVPPGAVLAGPFEGRLAPSGQIRLMRPGSPDPQPPGAGALVPDDTISYQSTAPWPEIPEPGNSLQRTQPRDYGNLPTSWTAGSPSPGTTEFFARLAGDIDGDGQFDRDDLVLMLQAGKYLTGEPAGWADGDFSGDGRVDPTDLVLALQAGGLFSP